jgi:hypothetical protein
MGHTLTLAYLVMDDPKFLLIGIAEKTGEFSQYTGVVHWVLPFRPCLVHRCSMITNCSTRQIRQSYRKEPVRFLGTTYLRRC